MSVPPGGRAARAAARIEAVAAPLCRWLNAVGAACLVVMAALTVLDVVGRYALGRPLRGALELTEFAMALLVFFGLGRTALANEHVIVDIAVAHVSARLRAAADALGAVLGMGLFGLIAWRSAAQARQLAAAGEVSVNLGLPVYPFVWAVALGSAALALVLAGRALGAAARAAGR